MLTAQEWLSAAGNHLWQTTVCAGVAVLLAWILRKNSAGVRHWIWLATSLKFLLPFSLLVLAGSQFHKPAVLPITAPALTATVRQMAQPFHAVRAVEMSAAIKGENVWPAAVFEIWLAGTIIVLAVWLRRWWSVRRVARTARAIDLEIGVEVRQTSTLIEPGVFGILRPVLLLPEGIRERLSAEHLAEIVEHELCHVQRRDNLAAAIHMLIEAIFWFHPLVWWLGARLVEERERACDEEVVRRRGKPELYAESILKTCEFYIESPVACMSGISGADLRERIVRIMARGGVSGLSLSRKLLLGGAAVAMLAVPITAGLVYSPVTTPELGWISSIEAKGPGHKALYFRIRRHDAFETRLNGSAANTSAVPQFSVISIKPSQSMRTLEQTQIHTGGRFEATGITLRMLLRIAYGVDEFQIAQAPQWLDGKKYDVVIAPRDTNGADIHISPDNEQKALAKALQSFFLERYKLAIHHETREVPYYSLVVAKQGPRYENLRVFKGSNRVAGEALLLPQPAPVDGGNVKGGGHILLEKIDMASFAHFLSYYVNGPVTDKTGLNDLYSFNLKWGPDANSLYPSTKEQEGGDDLFSAIHEQLGLTLEQQTEPRDILAIDSVQRPSEN